MHCNNYLYPVIKGCFKQNYKNPNQCLTYNFRAMLNIDLDNLMLWQILHPIPPCISFSLLPPNPCVCNLVYRESQSKGMVPYRVLTNHPSCKLKRGREEERVREGEEGRMLQGRKPLPNNLDGHLLCQSCPIGPVILVKGIFNRHHWKEIKVGYFNLLATVISLQKRHPQGPASAIDCPS